MLIVSYIIIGRALYITIIIFFLDEPSFKSKKRSRKDLDGKSPLDIIDDEELEHLQSDAEENEEEDEEKEGSIASDVDEENTNVKEVSIEPLYVLPLYAILSSDKQARVWFQLFKVF